MDPMQNLNNAADALNQVAERAGNWWDDADARLDSMEGDVAAFLADASLHHPLVRVSPNQWGTIDVPTSNLAGWAKNAGFVIDVEIDRTIESGTAWANRSADDQEFMTAMGMAEVVYFFPGTINVLKMTWSGAVANINNYTIFPPTVPVNGWVTVAAYSKLISGAATGPFLAGITDQWGLTGNTFDAGSNSYQNAHPYVTSESGEVHFALPAVALGRREINRDEPNWSWMPALNGSDPSDLTK